MKKKITNFKTIKAATMLALTVCCGIQKNTNAQTLVWPVNNDNYWYSSAGASNPIQGLNTAMIAYGPSLAPSFLFASAYYDGTSTPTIYITDPSLGVTCTIPMSGVSGVPDLQLGNYYPVVGSICTACTSAYTYYMLAVAYANTSSQVEIDYYAVYDDGISMVSVNTTPVLIQYESVTNTQTVHMDVAADYGTTSITGLPFCNAFSVTWDDYATGGPFVYVAKGDLNATNLTTNPITGISGAPATGQTPDVATVLYGSFPSIDTVSYVTYADASTNNALYMNTYAWVAGTHPTSTLDVGTNNSISISKPRIDAWDDYNQNSITGSDAVYKVVAEVDSNNANSTHVVRTYDNIQTSNGWPSSCVIDISGIPTYSVYPAQTYNSYAPTVANSSGAYPIFHFMEYGGTTGNDIPFMEPVAWVGNTLVGSRYFWVDSTSNPGSGTPPPVPINAYNTYATSVSSAANYGGPNSLYAWVQKDNTGSGIKYDVFYKLSYPVAMISRYTFREAAPAGITNIAGKGWQVYPNPAANELVVDMGTANDANGYQVMDMTGRMLAQGSLDGTRTTIDVNRLVAGTYLLKVYKDGAAYGETLFVKN